MFAEYDPAGARRDLPGPAVVRPATADDLTACARLLVDRSGGLISAWVARLATDLDDPHKALFVVEVGDVVGYGRASWFTAPHEAPRDVAPSGYYLTGVLVDALWRRRGLAELLTRARLEWVWRRAPVCWYFANATNRPSLDLHAKLGFQVVTSDFWFPGVTFEGGKGLPCRVDRP